VANDDNILLNGCVPVRKLWFSTSRRREAASVTGMDVCVIEAQEVSSECVDVLCAARAFAAALEGERGEWVSEKSGENGTTKGATVPKREHAQV
jgi:hypothetical protein